MSEKKEKKNKPSFFSKVGKFFREYRSELKKISWPTFPEVVKNTCITLVVVVLIGAVIWVADYLFGLGRNALISLENKAETSQTDVLDDSVSTVEDELDALTSSADAE